MDFVCRIKSNHITRYIAHEYANKGTKLINDIPKKMAIISMWMEVETHQFDPLVSKLTFELQMKLQLWNLKTKLAKVHVGCV
ncbi:Glutathione s-transferase [Thalictrum thalictroides]|uniref:glutathione transferase n=1 Tax=Thalictrum thalictroides TaxID=46969 RepID=A0A7J6V9P6_THATH|nr:Glutathione s-transferase [Thalictrum thalictroides]